MSEKYFEDFEVPKCPKPGEAPEPWKKTYVVGRRQLRHAVYEKVSGKAKFASDVRLPGMLYGVIVRSPHARAKVKSVDTSAAKKIPGVWDVIDASTPETKGLWLGSYTNDQVKLMMFDPSIRYEGFPVAPRRRCDPLGRRRRRQGGLLAPPRPALQVPGRRLPAALQAAPRQLLYGSGRSGL